MPHFIRLLLISDLHERGPRESEPWRKKHVLGPSWWENLREILKDGLIDIVCFIGDTANTGRRDEFDSATDFFWRTLRELGLDWSRFFVVPGNHDIRRPATKSAKNDWRVLRDKILAADPFVISRWMAGENRYNELGSRQRRQILRREAEHRTWLGRIERQELLPGSVHPHLGYRVTLRLPGRPFDLHVIGLDSAWLCGDANDSGNLLLTTDQIGRCVTRPDGAPLDGFRLVLIHHPFSDLRDGAEARERLAGRAHLVLRGHLHREEISEWADPDRGLREVAAGCLYEGRDGEGYGKGCAVIEIEADDLGQPLNYRLRFRSWSRRGGYWFDDNGLYRGTRDGRLTWRVQPPPTAAQIDPRVGQIFVGRDKERREVYVLLERSTASPIVPCVIEGPPGAGKSYLTDRFAQDHASDFPGGYVRLVLDPAKPTHSVALLEELARSLELPGRDADLGTRVRERLLRPLTLLHVENVDSDEAARGTADLLAGLSGCTVILTSRLRDLGLSLGWNRVLLGPFDEETALQQFEVEVGRPPATTAEQRELRELVRALGFLPLAIHIASGYLRAGYSAVTFLDRLRSEKLELPCFYSEEPVEARRTLAASFRISLDLLDGEPDSSRKPLLTAFRALAHAPAAGVGRGLGTAITGLTEPEFEDLVARATRLGLLTPVSRAERPDRAWRLHPLIAELLAHDADAVEIVARMTTWFLERLPEAPAGQESEQKQRWREIQQEGAALALWLARVEGSDRVRAERAGKVYAWANGPYRGWADLCEAALKAGATPEEQSHFLGTLASVLRRGGDLDRALAAAERKLKLDRQRGDPRGAGFAQGAISEILRVRGELDTALRLCYELLPTFDKLGDRRSCSIIRGRIADIHEERGELEEAWRIRNELIPIFQQLGDVRELTITFGKIADIFVAWGRLAEALSIRTTIELPVYKQLGDMRSRAITLGQIAEIFKLRKMLDTALYIRRREIPVYRWLGDARSCAATFGKIAEILQLRGDFDEALRIRKEEEIPVYERLKDARSLLIAWANLAEIHVKRDQDGDREQAVGLLSQALAEAERLRIPEANEIRARLDRPALRCP